MEIIDENSELKIINYTSKHTIKDVENQEIKYLVDFHKTGWVLNPVNINIPYHKTEDAKIFSDLDAGIIFVQEREDEINRGRCIIKNIVSSYEKYINVDIEIADDEIEGLEKEARLRCLSLEELIKVILIENILNQEKLKNRKLFNEIIDIYDIYLNPDILHELKDDTLILSPNGKNLVLIPNSSPSYEEIVKKLV